jgi:hypothetical protein
VIHALGLIAVLAEEADGRVGSFCHCKGGGRHVDFWSSLRQIQGLLIISEREATALSVDKYLK